jgi:hypothetical protein
VYIAHYKSVNTSDEFYSENRSTLDFPSQVELNSLRYYLYRTLQVDTPSKMKNFKDMVTNHGVRSGINVD